MSVAKESSIRAEPRAAYCSGYSDTIENIREHEYPLLKETTYLDHAGTTPYAKSLITSFSNDLTSNLYGNPHSMSASSQLSSQRVDDIRLRALRFFNADPDEFDLVFVPNATAGIKLVADSLKDSKGGFWYGYLVDAHTSLVGVREVGERGSRCFFSEKEVDEWVDGLGSGQEGEAGGADGLFAYPAQSNMNGRRFPMQWCESIRTRQRNRNITAGNYVYTLLDAASLVSTSPLDLSNAAAAPDFTVLSFYKIFGFPDLGALIVRKSAGALFDNRKFFGGGTVDMVLTEGGPNPWHAKKQSSIHESLEDGTLPFHNIIALDSAFDTHRRLYGSMENIASHTLSLAKDLHDRMTTLIHYNGGNVCQLYTGPSTSYGDPAAQGPIVAFNLRNSTGMWIGKSEVERLASTKNIQIRSGTLCNPGGTAVSLGWTGADMARHYSAGMRCGDDNDIMDERPTGILRVSLGAMSNQRDIDTFMAFLDEFYVEKPPEALQVPLIEGLSLHQSPQPSFYVESLSVFPIKSCGAYRVPDGQRWEVRREGLAWDREWCLVHQGTGATLNQKRYPRMALIQPTIDLQRGTLRIACSEAYAVPTAGKTLEISLDRGSNGTNSLTTALCQNTSKTSTVCGDKVVLRAYTSPAVSSFFTTFLGVPCTLARFPPQSSTRSFPQPHLSKILSPNQNQGRTMPGSFPQGPFPPHLHSTSTSTKSPILLSNESPLLLISRSSVNRLNESIKSAQAALSNNHSSTAPAPRNLKRAVAADVFRANIIVAETIPTAERPYIEDSWSSVAIGPRPRTELASSEIRPEKQLNFNVLGSCERCQMVCVDQYTGTRGEEPYATLAKTRKVGRKILFGRHISPTSTVVRESEDEDDECLGTVMVGDVVSPSYEDEDGA
ncbi:pyridoxal phosphate-dependent transferase [Aspergillus unguis]